MKPQPLHIKDGKKEYYIAPEEILFVQADGNYCEFHLTSHIRYPTVRIQIGQLEQMLNEHPYNGLHRTGRSFMINLDYVKYVDPKKSTVTLHTDEDVQVEGMSKAAITDLLAKLSREKRKEVLKPVSYNQVLIVDVKDLNDDHPLDSGHEYVDLGLPSGTLWATEDIGGDYPAYFSWGDLYESDKYRKDEYVHHGIGSIDKLANETEPKEYTKHYAYEDDGEVIEAETYFVSDRYELKTDYDVAHQRWGGFWHMPTSLEVKELFEECVFTWCTDKYKQKGCLVTGPNGNRIFLAASGYVKDVEVRDKNVVCKYWTASSGNDRVIKAKTMTIEDGTETAHCRCLTDDTYKGLAIRPVMSAHSESVPVPPAKRMLIIPEFHIGDNCFTIPPMANELYNIHGWELDFMDIPFENSSKFFEPEQLLGYVKKECEKRHPDLIVCFSSGCFFCKELESYPRIFIAPDRTPSKIFMEWFEMEGSTDADLKDIAGKYEELEQAQVYRGGDNCWLLALDCDYLFSHDDEYFGDWVPGLFPELERQGYWIETFLYPFIKEVYEPGYSYGLYSSNPFASKVLDAISY